MKLHLVLLFSFFHLAALGQYTLIWSDEFGGTDLNLNQWTYDIGQGDWGWGNNELQYYTNSSSNVSVDNGYLNITALNEQFGSANYTSARIKSKGLFDFTYGRVEARIKVPVGQGLWPAFWMLGANIDNVSWPQCGEIDVMEHINNETIIHGTHHYNNNGWQYSGGSVSCDANEFQVYSIEWSPLSIQWFLNDVMYYETDISSSSISKEEFHEPFFFLINLAVGGNWPGSPNGATQFPAVMQVDYVRVYQDANVGCTDPAADNYNPNATTDDGSCTYASATLSITTTVCNSASSVRMTGPWWGWDSAAGPAASDNGDGSWTFTFDPAPTDNMEYLLVVDGVQENLIEDMVDGGSCAPITDYWSYANRQWLAGSGDVSNVYGTCGECGSVDLSGCTDTEANNYDASASSDNGSCMYDVTLTVDMNCSGLTPLAVAATGPSEGWSCGNYALTDVDGDGVWEGTFGLPAGSFEYIYCTDGWAEQETPGLIEEMQNGESCAPVTDYANWANRLITVGAITTVDTWGSCSECITVDPGCPEDVDNNGFVTVSDVLTVLSEFGCSAGCQYDLNMDGIVGVSDILEILAAFGNEC
ncbi:MAG: family 16 glycosylhydrolase [Flavobacteriales bacterium]|nr:family 16 glycosylhydrolase [Flavobacteriales bacterium]